MMWKLTAKKAECRKIDAFKLWCWRRLLRVPWTARRSNQWILKGNQSWIFIGMTDAETPILWPPDAKNWHIGKDPDGGKDWRQRRRWQQRMRWLENMVDLTDRNLSKLREIVENIGAWCAAVHGVAKCQSRLSHWITTSTILKRSCHYHLFLLILSKWPFIESSNAYR